MKSRTGFFVLAAVLLFVFAVVVFEGVQLIATGKPAGIGIGVCAMVIPAIGVWFLWHTVQFGRRSEAMARELEAEGGLPVDELVRTPGGRIDRASADAVFARRQAQAEESPGDWRVWFRLAVAYADAGDTPRARRTMQHAIRLHTGA
ncbi:tetratricopeptide repeat protein [Peterkaempfera griseoplana]|uniref:tetratricopeptide repeat protein n=1 Tax=Peterkaempfera griseoplana TaxID=66896 RepID=UPI0006E26998|nr:tetratricopeptide repeat protein [Peterkaempfera griseoplana]